jgi:excisionase family DNA binding protein
MTTPIVAGNVDHGELEKLQAFAAALPEGSDLSILLAHMVKAIRDGLDVALVDLDAELTPNQAADFLRMSRPHLLKLLDEGYIPFHRVGSHRRVRNSDLVAFLTRREVARKEMAFVQAHRTDLEWEAAAETSGLSQDLLARLT